MARLIRVDRNGTKYYEGDVPCERCGGAGRADKWQFTGFTCYKCGGSGKQFGKWKEYTPEYEAKLEERRRKRREKWEADHAEEIAQRKAEQEARERERLEAERRAEEERLAEEARIKAEKAKSQYIGNVGEKLELKVECVKTAWFEVKSFSGYGMDLMYVHTFRTLDGNVLVWKTGKGLGSLELECGQVVTLKGTVKEHSVYDDCKQTVMTRCKIIP